MDNTGFRLRDITAYNDPKWGAIMSIARENLLGHADRLFFRDVDYGNSLEILITKGHYARWGELRSGSTEKEVTNLCDTLKKSLH